MGTSFYISTTKVDGGVRVSAEDIERFLQIYGKRRDENGKGMSMTKYIGKLIGDIESGRRVGCRGTKITKGSLQAMRQAMKKWDEFQCDRGQEIDFMDVDMHIYREYCSWLIGQDYSANSIGKCIKILKQVLKYAEEDFFSVNQAYRSRAFKVHSVRTDAIYLTREDLDALEAVDLSQMPPCWIAARDIFMIGVWSAQRVSDYNNLSWENIFEEEITTLRLTQKKTGKRVVIPCCHELRSILGRYKGKPLPHLYDQKINDIMKQIGRLAGLDTPVEIRSTKGGITTSHILPKWQLIQTHTARRTGATLMYLSGMDVYDICKITGHSSIQTLERYIKASELETVKKITAEYDYFK